MLGGTTEASALARMLAARGDAAVLSYAGRVASPKVQPIPTRVGGFGGVEGLATYLSDHGVTHLVDAIRYLPAETQVVLCAGAPDTPEIATERPAAMMDGNRLFTLLRCGKLQAESGAKGVDHQKGGIHMAALCTAYG